MLRAGRLVVFSPLGGHSARIHTAPTRRTDPGQECQLPCACTACKHPRLSTHQAQTFHTRLTRMHACSPGGQPGPAPAPPWMQALPILPSCHSYSARPTGPSRCAWTCAPCGAVLARVRCPYLWQLPAPLGCCLLPKVCDKPAKLLGSRKGALIATPFAALRAARKL